MNTCLLRGALVLAALLAIILGAGGPAGAVEEKFSLGPSAPKPPSTATEQSNLKALTITLMPPFADPSRRGALLLPIGTGPRPLQSALEPMTWSEDTRAATIPDLRIR